MKLNLTVSLLLAILLNGISDVNAVTGKFDKNLIEWCKQVLAPTSPGSSTSTTPATSRRFFNFDEMSDIPSSYSSLFQRRSGSGPSRLPSASNSKRPSGGKVPVLKKFPSFGDAFLDKKIRDITCLRTHYVAFLQKLENSNDFPAYRNSKKFNVIHPPSAQIHDADLRTLDHYQAANYCKSLEERISAAIFKHYSDNILTIQDYSPPAYKLIAAMNALCRNIKDDESCSAEFRLNPYYFGRKAYDDYVKNCFLYKRDELTKLVDEETKFLKSLDTKNPYSSSSSGGAASKA